MFFKIIISIRINKNGSSERAKERLKTKSQGMKKLKLLSHVQLYMDKGREVEEWVVKDIAKLKHENILSIYLLSIFKDMA